MTIYDIKKINHKLSELKSKKARLEGEITGGSQKLTGLPGSGSEKDKVGTNVPQIVDIQREIQDLEILRNSILNKLSRDKMEENCIFMFFGLHYSWTKIAMECGGKNTADSVRKMCERYKW